MQFFCQTNELYWDKDNCLEFNNKLCLEWRSFSSQVFFESYKVCYLYKNFNFGFRIFKLYRNRIKSFLFHSPHEIVLLGKMVYFDPEGWLSSLKFFKILDNWAKSRYIYSKFKGIF